MSAETDTLKDRPFFELAPVPSGSPIVPAAAVYAAEFGFGPFGDTWYLRDGISIPGLYANPRTLASFTNELLDPANEVTAKLTEEHHLCTHIPNGLLRQHVERTIEDPMTAYLVETERLTPDDMAALRSLLEILGVDPDGKTEIRMTYPLTDVLNTYAETSRQGYSLVQVGYQINDAQLRTGEVHYQRITDHTSLPEGIYPRTVGRVVSLNHPKEGPRHPVHPAIASELGYYLTQDEMEQVLALVPESSYVAILAEIAKVPGHVPDRLLTDGSHDVIKNVFLTALSNYMRVLTDQSSLSRMILAYRRHPDLAPEYLIFYTMEGTATGPKRNARSSSLARTTNPYIRPTGIQYDESLLKFENAHGIVYVSVMKKRRILL